MVELTNYNQDEFEPLGSFEPMPVGDYVVVIESSEKKKATTGDNNYYLQFVYNVIDGDFKGRKVFDRLNVENESDQAQTIAKRALTSICIAVGAHHPRNTEELHDKPFMVNLGIRPAKGEYGPSNVVKGYKMANGDKIGATPSSVPSQSAPAEKEAPAAATGKKEMPWNKKKK
jgi:hypothetical protein